VRAGAAALAALALLAAAAPAQGHTLRESKVRHFLSPSADEFAAVVETELRVGSPSLQIVHSGVGDCERRTRHRIDCDLAVTIRDPADQTDLTCSVRARVKFAGAHSRRLTLALGRTVTCAFTIELEQPPA
jgi:hypothetical protein